MSLKGNELQFTGEMEGKIPSYLFADEGLTVAVSKRGGYIVYLLSSANAGEVKITEKQAIENARKFLENNGYASGMLENFSDYKISDLD